ncbi:carbohydrate-binding module family 13 protein [Serendipita vermifera MAFF 305830]|uniref:Carbohydrate-binding module family 13 protein n=1 Tax=Serendipita vermifera MAFF 305830 TaxID=933852 RepID=A0A0C3ATL2_SERVB|nr:carbohydrate-binding module family 13 protein [Serendipita vermifera MAFF 305830]
MSLTAALLAATLFLGVSAQTPFYTGEVYLQPGNNSNKCYQTSNYNGAPVVIADCDTSGNSADQKWTFSGGSVKIYNGQKCLDVTDGNTADGTKLQVWDCYPNSVNQQFYFTRDYHLAWTNHGKCVDLTDGSMANGNKIQLWSCSGTNPNQRVNTGYMFNKQPTKSQNGQTGTNACGTGSSDSSNCQTLVINSIDDFCLWGPPTTATIGDSEAYEVAYCTKGGHGTRVMPQGTLKGVHFVKTPDYVQVTGVGDFTKIHVKARDDGGELDNHGADGNGNPAGGLVYGTPFSSSGVPAQFHEWTNFMSATEFCIRACTGPNAANNCNHIYDVMGCTFNMPASYSANVFESCQGDDSLPVGIYTNGNSVSTWYQGVNPTPSAHPIPSSSNCVTTATVGYGN